MNEFYNLYPSSNLKEIKMLSDYFAKIKNTPVDTEIYIYAGKEKGGTSLILGGTHPNEPAGYLTSILFLENIDVQKGKVIIIPRTNKSAFTHAASTEAYLKNFSIDLNNDKSRKFRLGSRNTNSGAQQPIPLFYKHSSGQILAGKESLNLNRAYPGNKNGNLTEKLAFAIIELIKKENIDITFDLHEASPEYPVINAIVAHPKGIDTALMAVMDLQMQGIEFFAESSPEKFRGLSHREFGDYTQTVPFLFETPNPLQGKYKGKISRKTLITGYDQLYTLADDLGLIYIDYSKKGWPIKKRIALQTTLITNILSIFNRNHSKKEIFIKNIPNYNEIINNGLSSYLNKK